MSAVPSTQEPLRAELQAERTKLSAVEAELDLERSAHGATAEMLVEVQQRLEVTLQVAQARPRIPNRMRVRWAGEARATWLTAGVAGACQPRTVLEEEKLSTSNRPQPGMSPTRRSVLAVSPEFCKAGI